MRKIPFLLLTIFTMIIIAVIIALVVFSFSKYIGSSCDEPHMIKQIHYSQGLKNFLKNYPDAKMEIKDDTIHKYQCMYWFYHMDEKFQDNLWVLTDNNGNVLRESLMCVDNVDTEPIFFAPHDVPDITQEFCD